MTSAYVGGCLPQAACTEDFSPKSQDAGIAADWGAVALYLWLIVVISVRQSDRCGNIWASLPGAGCGRFEHQRLSSLIAKFKEAGRDGQRDWCMSRVTAIISALVICIIHSACHGLLIITVITPLPTKPSATKMPENWKLANAAITDAGASAWCCCAGECKIHPKGLWLNAKAENDALRDDVAAGRRQFVHQSSLSVSAWSAPPPRRG